MGAFDNLHLTGLVIGICTFLIIGLFHPVVVKCEYYFGTRCWWVFLLLGLSVGGERAAVDPPRSLRLLLVLDHQGNL